MSRYIKLAGQTGSEAGLPANASFTTTCSTCIASNCYLYCNTNLGVCQTLRNEVIIASCPNWEPPGGLNVFSIDHDFSQYERVRMNFLYGHCTSSPSFRGGWFVKAGPSCCYTNASYPPYRYGNMCGNSSPAMTCTQYGGFWGPELCFFQGWDVEFFPTGYGQNYTSDIGAGVSFRERGKDSCLCNYSFRAIEGHVVPCHTSSGCKFGWNMFKGFGVTSHAMNQGVVKCFTISGIPKSGEI